MAESDKNQQVAKTASKVALTVKLITEQPTTKAMLDLPAIRENWIETYAKVSGKSLEDAAIRFEAEKIMFLQTVAGSTTLAKTDKFTQYTAFLELSISGGTLRDGLCYIIPFKGKAQFMPGWKLRLEQVNELPDVIYCHEPVVVYDCDAFDFEMGQQPRIITHKPGARTAANRPTHVYWVIDFKHGSRVYIMDAVKVLQIRDQYSESYKAYIKALEAPENKGKKPGDKLTIKYFKDGQWASFESDDVPMWVKDESQAFQKTIVKQVWKHLPKLPKQKWLDDRLKAGGAADVDADDVLHDKRGGAVKEEELDSMVLKDDRQGAVTNTSVENLEFTDMPTGEQQQPAGAENITTEQPDDVMSGW